VRSPSSPLVEVTVSPIFLRTVPDRKPRTECGNQPVAFISSFEVAPPGRFSRSRILAVLLPSRATLGLATSGLARPLGAFLAGVALRADLALEAQRWRDEAQRGPFCSVSASCCLPRLRGCRFLLESTWSFSILLCGYFAVTTWITPERLKCKSNLHRAPGRKEFPSSFSTCLLGGTERSWTCRLTA
jgi:hypothetical protein